MVSVALRRNAISGRGAKVKQPNSLRRAKPGPDITYMPNEAGKSGPLAARVMRQNFL
jgi:hypothetical protein